MDKKLTKEMENLLICFLTNEKFLLKMNIPPDSYYDERREGDHEEDYDDYNTSNTTVKETTFTTPCSTN